MDYMEKISAKMSIEKHYEWRKWTGEIPFLQFPSDWEVKVIPPFGGAIVRFMIRKENANVSVYLDCYGELGAVNEPYWEAFPSIDGDVHRSLMSETDDLLEAISISIEDQNIK
jgi:hypothetical protein